ncbi:unnamed protein product [Phytomonas sp. Hart1]|nr:unnamed protein product [Phytomonas sp. Hart1]|eukprot:CCW67909.1 unnamed protein product [Phytomonas sp. isolate Hart1]
MLCSLWSHLSWGGLVSQCSWQALLARPLDPHHPPSSIAEAIPHQTTSPSRILPNIEADYFTSSKDLIRSLRQRNGVKTRIRRILRVPAPSTACAKALRSSIRTYFSQSFVVRSSSGSDSHPRTIAVQLHNLPKNWLHEEIIEFIHQVAEYAGIEAPGLEKEESDEGEDQHPALNKVEEAADPQEWEATDEDSAIPHVTSPFIRHLRVPFGRRTGLIYGKPTLELTSTALAHYLVEDLQLDPDDYRSQICFTYVELEGEKAKDGPDGSTPRRRPTTYHEIEETIEHEQAEALRTLELDRYLMAPDLLLDITKSYQLRRLTKNEKVFLDSFLDDDEDNIDGLNTDHVEDDDEADKMGTILHKKQKTQKSRKGHITHKKRTVRELNDLGRGSMQNIPIPKPYVQGRNL